MNIRVMVFPGAHNLPLWLMDNLEIRYTKSRDEQIAAIQNGAVDVIHTSPDNLFLPDATGLVPFLAGTVGPLELVATGRHEEEILAVDNPQSGFGRLAYKWLRENKPDVHYVIAAVGGTPQRLEALKSQKATIAVMHPPFTEFCKEAGYTVLGRIDFGYPTLCAVSREDLRESQTIATYREAYGHALERLSGREGARLAREAFLRSFPDMQSMVRDGIADVMRREVVEAGVEFDRELLEKLRDLPL